MYFKRVNFMVFELYLNKAVRNKTSTQHHHWAAKGPPKTQGDECIEQLGKKAELRAGSQLRGKASGRKVVFRPIPSRLSLVSDTHDCIPF